jgi:hypothetical protein
LAPCTPLRARTSPFEGRSFGEERFGVQGEPQARGAARIALCRELHGPSQVLGANFCREGVFPASDLDRRPYHLYLPSSLALRSPPRDSCARHLGTLLGFGDRTDHPTGNDRPRRFSGPMFAGRRVRRKAQERSAVEKHTANTQKYRSGVRRTDAPWGGAGGEKRPRVFDAGPSQCVVAAQGRRSEKDPPPLPRTRGSARWACRGPAKGERLGYRVRTYPARASHEPTASRPPFVGPRGGSGGP